MTATTTKTLEATLAPPTAHKERHFGSIVYRLWDRRWLYLNLLIS